MRWPDYFAVATVFLYLCWAAGYAYEGQRWQAAALVGWAFGNACFAVAGLKS